MSNKTKTVILILILVIVGLGGLLLKKDMKSPIPATNTPTTDQEDNISISTPEAVSTPSEKNIKESNFSGTISIIKGSSVLANTAREYVDKTIASFKKSADEEVPLIREKFGEDSPTSEYNIEIKSTYTKGNKTESIILDEYVYTGGANGDSRYKVFTALSSNGNILSFKDVIKASKQSEFTALMKKKLADWRPEGGKYPVVFPEEVQALTFESFSNFSFDSNNLIIYFDKYQIGPGVLGSVAFKIPLSQIKDLLVSGYY